VIGWGPFRFRPVTEDEVGGWRLRWAPVRVQDISKCQNYFSYNEGAVWGDAICTIRDDDFQKPWELISDVKRTIQITMYYNYKLKKFLPE
jgi:hypothetical protein